ncbi:hypothetical protein HOU00_gp139 [Caulobacter phage CcrPW]|uniref:Uncharacterized protein n=1 Tax=Caulobacter phage CcrPW TaxID=2283271 RepID=A0A385EB94_9CAUD|nr:hypothetical protein HOU00_gp139 [Caulobacter phage CcrPW]AXQ68986.1 hypothetical protein CcrPW_gp447 [Caulobacter phage CcrPW]
MTSRIKMVGARTPKLRMFKRSGPLRGKRASIVITDASGPIPSEDGISWTADHVIDDPREPRITPTGILDHRGMMLLRVAVPIKVPMGFAIPQVNPPERDEVETLVPEDMLAVSEVGLGIGFVTPEEAEESEEDQASMLMQLIEAALEHTNGDKVAAKALLAEQGIEITFKDEIEPKDATP